MQPLNDQPDTSAYRPILLHFIQVIRQESEVAANCIEQIQEQYGTRPAYLAAYAVLVMKQQHEEYKRPIKSTDLNTYTFYDEWQHQAFALALYRQAAVNLFPVGGLSKA